MDLGQLGEWTWPASRVGDAVAALVRHAGLESEGTVPAGVSTPTDAAGSGAHIEWLAKRMKCEAEQVETNYRDLEAMICGGTPALLKLADGIFLVIAAAKRDHVQVLTPDARLQSVSVSEICQVLREPVIRDSRTEFGCLMDEAGIRGARRDATLTALLREQLGQRRFDQCWTIRFGSQNRPWALLREAGALGNGAGLLVTHTGQYLLWLVSWAILGSLSLSGRMDRGWLLAWALLLMTLIPFRVLTTWMQGLLAIGVGGFLKRRLLLGALRLCPEEVRHGGVGTFLGQALEAEAVETLALSGGIASVLAVIELAVSSFVLGRFALLLAVWFGVTVVITWRFIRRYQTWTDTRMEMTQDLVESMVGHRTRLAQQPKDQWHEAEDAALARYYNTSQSIDGTGTWLVAAIPRGWLLAGLSCLIPAIVSGKSATSDTAVLLGGTLLAYTAFGRLTGSLTEVAAAWVAWKRIAPLLEAASRPEELGELPPGAQPKTGDGALIEADRLVYRYRQQGAAVVKSCSLAIQKGERILLEGPSGGGKTTFASLLSNMRQPESGLLLVNGLDRHTLGTAGWRSSITAAPQFHENHILTETLAFNLLMGRRWPPTQSDMADAETLCRELGLGDLLDRMPSGLQQMVGEGGWQLSHGEKSRVFMARALLQRSEMIVLDESFAALDPENLQVALECTLERASTLMVIAHP